MDASRTNTVIVALLCALVAAACGPGTQGTPPANPPTPPANPPTPPGTPGIPEQQLRSSVAPAFQSDVMIFGTTHLAGHGDALTPAHLASTLEALERFCPTRIAVEVLPTDEVSIMHEHATQDASAAGLLDTFARDIVKLGKLAQAQLHLDRIEARRELAPLLKNTPTLGADERARLILLLLAAYEYPTALLQWSYLAPEARADARWPAEVRARLDAALGSGDEVSSIAIALAGSLGLQEIHAIDSQIEALRTLAMPQDALEELYSQPSRQAWRSSAASQERLLRHASFDTSMGYVHEHADLASVVNQLPAMSRPRLKAA